jgi:hypothetical protein
MYISRKTGVLLKMVLALERVCAALIGGHVPRGWLP